MSHMLMMAICKEFKIKTLRLVAYDNQSKSDQKTFYILFDSSDFNVSKCNNHGIKEEYIHNGKISLHKFIHMSFGRTVSIPANVCVFNGRTLSEFKRKQHICISDLPFLLIFCYGISIPITE